MSLWPSRAPLRRIRLRKGHWRITCGIAAGCRLGYSYYMWDFPPSLSGSIILAILHLAKKLAAPCFSIYRHRQCNIPLLPIQTRLYRLCRPRQNMLVTEMATHTLKLFLGPGRAVIILWIHVRVPTYSSVHDKYASSFRSQPLNQNVYTSSLSGFLQYAPMILPQRAPGSAHRPGCHIAAQKAHSTRLSCPAQLLCFQHSGLFMVFAIIQTPLGLGI